MKYIKFLLAFMLILGLGFGQDLRTNVYWIGNNNDAPVSKTETEALDVLADAIDGINSTKADLLYAISGSSVTAAELTLLGGMNNAALDTLADLSAAELDVLDGDGLIGSFNAAALDSANDLTAAEFDVLDGNSAILDTLTDLSVAEVEYLDGADSTNATGQKVPIFDSNGYLVQGFKVFGTLNDSLTTVEYGDGRFHQTVFTLANVEFPSIAGGADLAVGVALGTLPAGDIAIHRVYIDLDLNEDDGNVTADTPDLGIGTTIGSGAVATLDGTPAFENIMTGQQMNDCNETDEEFGEARYLLVKSGDSHIVYLNVADGWAASGEDNLQATGTVVIEWSFLK